MSIICCPVCGQKLQPDKQQWFCDNNHRFDIARQGYVNLLLANQKKSSTPGDDRQMLDARCRFLSAGYYQPIAETLLKLVQENCKTSNQVIDVGCGEGYYLAYLQQRLANSPAEQNREFYGADISRDALKIAARNHASIHWLVSAAKNLPFLAHKADLVINIFAPADWQEIHRVLKKSGHAILAVAGDTHLMGLREFIYNEVRPHRPSRFLDRISSDFELITTQNCQFDLQLSDNSAIRSLLQMTPFYWQASKERRQAIENLQSLKTPVNVQFYLFQARE